MGEEDEMNVPQEAAEPAVEQTLTGQTDEPRVEQPAAGQTDEPADERQMAGRTSNIHSHFAQKLLADEGTFSWNTGDWELPPDATLRRRDGQATIQLPDNFPAPARAQ